MKKTLFASVLLMSATAFAQTGKVGVNTPMPSETLHVNGTARVSSLPVSGSGKIYNGAATQSTTFTATQTVVADANGNLGVVSGIPSSGAPNEKTYWYAAPNSTTTITLTDYPANSNIFIYAAARNASATVVSVNLPAASSTNAGQWYNVCNVGNGAGGSYAPKITLYGLLNMQYGGGSSTFVGTTSGSRCVKVVASNGPGTNYSWVTVSND
ncbi:hypothetical protein IMZ16_03900 [Cruoricaptor ignavus]|uniref:Uncharacterized protein n=1 Tax=Cruoricaptor ignavus TaxID=1118202 RepID=A0A7M1T3Z1_9FLAO|nr:hypothetical protein [Cruoricaptor ignavus]QOR74586.1 hypothetical protein IMZ16_03900 [Cruoricaptor ignavus]